MERLQGSTASPMIGVVQVVLRIASAVLFPSDVFVIAAGVHTLLRCQSHDGSRKHAPPLAGTHGARSVSFCMGACAWLLVCIISACLQLRRHSWRFGRSIGLPQKGAPTCSCCCSQLRPSRNRPIVSPLPPGASLRLHTPAAEGVHGHHEGYSSMRDHAAVLDGTCGDGHCGRTAVQCTRTPSSAAARASAAAPR